MRCSAWHGPRWRWPICALRACAVSYLRVEAAARRRIVDNRQIVTIREKVKHQKKVQRQVSYRVVLMPSPLENAGLASSAGIGNARRAIAANRSNLSARPRACGESMHPGWQPKPQRNCNGTSVTDDRCDGIGMRANGRTRRMYTLPLALTRARPDTLAIAGDQG